MIDTLDAKVVHVLDIKDEVGQEPDVLEVKLAVDEDFLVAYVDIKCAFDDKLAFQVSLNFCSAFYLVRGLIQATPFLRA